MLYFYPPHEITADDSFEMGMTTDDMITLKDTRYVNFEGIEICKNRFNPKLKSTSSMENAKGNAFYLWYTDNIKITNCKIHDIANSGIVMRGTNITVDGCEFYNIAANGILTVGGGDLDTLTHSDNVISNNHFWNMSTDNASNLSGAVEMSGAGNLLYGEAYGEYDIGMTVKNNIIHGLPSTGIYLSGMENTIKDNEIYNCVNYRSDAGSIYCGRMWGQFGNVIEHNYIHEIGMNKNIHASSGVYIDDRQSGTTVKDNIMEINNIYDGCGVFINMGAYKCYNPFLLLKSFKVLTCIPFPVFGRSHVYNSEKYFLKMLIIAEAYNT